MGLFDDDSFEEQLWTDAWIEEVDREAAMLGLERAECQDIQDDIDSGLYTKEEIMDMHGIDESDLDVFDTDLLEDDS